MGTLLIILGRVLASPFVNVFQKKLTNHQVRPELVVMVSYLFFVILAIPVIIIKHPFYFPPKFWTYIILLGIFDIFGNMFLVKSLRTIELSVFGPLNSFKPVFALLFSMVLLNEIPSIVGSIGVVIIILGSYFLGYKPKSERSRNRTFSIHRGIILRFLAILLTSIAAVFSKKTILMSSPLITLAYWSIIGFPISLFFYRYSNGKKKYEIKEVGKFGWLFVGLLISFLALQMLTLLTFEKVYVGYSLALFQLSGVVSVFFGFHFFKERNIKYRLIGAAIMCVGAVLIALFG